MKIEICDNCGGHTGPAISKLYDKVVDSIVEVEGLHLCPDCEVEYKEERKALHQGLNSKFSNYVSRVLGLGQLI